jgi:selenoprotein W-related protein
MKEVLITYCRPCGYAKRAEEIAAALKEVLHVDAKVVPGKGGIFNISVEGKVVAKRTREGFPSKEQVIKAVKGIE